MRDHDASSPRSLPWRADGPGRPAPPLDLASLPTFIGMRPRKRWRYVAAFGPEVQLCIGVVHIGPGVQSFWAVHDRVNNVFAQHATYRASALLDDDHVRCAGGQMTADLRVTPAGDAVEVVSRHGAHPVWTRKTPLHLTGQVTLHGRHLTVDSLGLRDDTDGHHARHTVWNWSAGAGTDAQGRSVVWNLVRGIHDDPALSENTVWLDGTAHRVDVPEFAGDLSTLTCADARLTFAAEAERARHDRMLLIRSNYRQPFGAFGGTLPHGVVLTRGYGVMEDHDAHW